MEDKLLNLLAPLEKEEQTVVKLGSLLCVSSCSVMPQCVGGPHGANPEQPDMLFSLPGFWNGKGGRAQVGSFLIKVQTSAERAD